MITSSKKSEKQLLAAGETPTFHVQSVPTSMISYGPSAPAGVSVFGIVLHTNNHRKPSERVISSYHKSCFASHTVERPHFVAAELKSPSLLLL